jgi:precorrin-8X/cobalt-precorrin-8 methylmutase
MPALFDTYVIVDWSAASQPKTGRDSIWICRLGRDRESVSNPPTRHAAKGMLADMLAGASERGERVLLGFDFPFGYPAGFAARLGLAGTPWRALWDEIAGLLHDNENNRTSGSRAEGFRSGDVLPNRWASFSVRAITGAIPAMSRSRSAG